MQFVITAHDGKNVLEQRMAVRPEHLANMARLGSHVLKKKGSTPRVMSGTGTASPPGPSWWWTSTAGTGWRNTWPPSPISGKRSGRT